MKSTLPLLVLALSACAGPAAEVTVVPITPETPAPEAAPSAGAPSLASDKAAEIAAELEKENAAVNDVLGKGPSASVHGGPGSGAPPDVPGPSVRLLRATSTPELSDMARVIAGLRPAFIRCYVNALKRNPEMSGGLTLDAKIGANGEVTSVKVRDAKGVPSDVSGCINGALRSVRFQAPQGGAATLTLPLNLSPK